MTLEKNFFIEILKFNNLPSQGLQNSFARNMVFIDMLMYHITPNWSRVSVLVFSFTELEG